MNVSNVRLLYRVSKGDIVVVALFVTLSAMFTILGSAEPDAGNPSVEPGISDVKSGSEETSLNRDRYSDW